MKWFRHFSTASDDEFLSELETLFGWEGYGRWWKLLETIAKQMDNTDRCHASYSWSDWQRFLKGKRNKLDSFLVHCQNKQKINLKQNGNILEISCPKLLELRDEYSKKSGQKADKCPSQIQKTDTEEEEVSKKESKVIGSRFALTDPPQDWIQFCITQRPDLDPGGVFDAFRDYWIAKPGKDGIKLDWIATWRNWVRNQHGSKGTLNGKPAKSKLELAAEGIAAARAKREQASASQTG